MPNLHCCLIDYALKKNLAATYYGTNVIYFQCIHHKILRFDATTKTVIQVKS